MWRIKLRSVRTPAANRLRPTRKRQSDGKESSREQCYKIENLEVDRGSGLCGVCSQPARVGPGNAARHHVPARECPSAGTEECWHRAAFERTDSARSHL